MRRTTAEALVPIFQNHDGGTSHFEEKFQKTPALEEVLALLRKRESLVISTPEECWEATSGAHGIGLISHLTHPLCVSFDKVPEAYWDSTETLCGWVLSRIEFALMRKNGR